MNPRQVLRGEAEAIGFELVASRHAERPPSDMEGLARSLSRLQALLDNILKYVEDVCVSDRQQSLCMGLQREPGSLPVTTY
jgi:hypothetical protein